MLCDDLLEADLGQLERALQEFRRACAEQVSRGVLSRGLLPAEPFTAEQFIDGAAISEDRAAEARLLLRALSSWGIVRPTGEGRYEATDRPPAFAADPALIRQAIGRDDLDGYPDFDNFAGLAETLVTSNDATAASFDRANLPLWEMALQVPYYRYSRIQAVAALSRAGNRLLDLACGLGHGLQEMAAALGPDPQARLVGVEISADFAALAAERTADDPRITLLRADLDEPLTGLPTSGFDGAMIVGGYHFLTRPDVLWATVARLVRPSGTFVAAHVLSRTGTPDEPLMELRFAVRRPAGRPTERTDLLALAADHGFTLTGEFHLGCYRTMEFRREPDGSEQTHRPPTVRELDDLTITTIPVGPMATNAYLLHCRSTGAELLIDAGAEPGRILSAGRGRLTAVATTHGDWDHTQALPEILAATGARSLAHGADIPLLNVPSQPVADGDTIVFGDCAVQVIHVAGHTPGSVVFALRGTGAAPDHLFTGDALFPGGPGTTWGDTATFDELLDNVEHRLFDAFDDDTVVLPGHGPATTIGTERAQLPAWRRRRW